MTRRYLWLVALVFTPIAAFCAAEVAGLTFATSVRRTLGGWYFGLSFTVVAGTALTASQALNIRRLKRSARQHGGLICTACAYPMALDATTCPECGTVQDMERTRSAWEEFDPFGLGCQRESAASKLLVDGESTLRQPPN